MKFKSRKFLKAEIRKLEMSLEISEEGRQIALREAAEFRAKVKEQEKSFAKMRHELKTAKEQKEKFEALAGKQKEKLRKIRQALDARED